MSAKTKIRIRLETFEATAPTCLRTRMGRFRIQPGEVFYWPGGIEAIVDGPRGRAWGAARHGGAWTMLRCNRGLDPWTGMGGVSALLEAQAERRADFEAGREWRRKSYTWPVPTPLRWIERRAGL